MNYNKLLFKQ